MKSFSLNVLQVILSETRPLSFLRFPPQRPAAPTRTRPAPNTSVPGSKPASAASTRRFAKRIILAGDCPADSRRRAGRNARADGTGRRFRRHCCAPVAALLGGTVGLFAGGLPAARAARLAGGPRPRSGLRTGLDRHRGGRLRRVGHHGRRGPAGAAVRPPEQLAVSRPRAGAAAGLVPRPAARNRSLGSSARISCTIASDWPHLETFWRAHLAPGGIVLLGEGGRSTGGEFPDWLDGRGWRLDRTQTTLPGHPRPIRLFQLQLARP